MARHAWHVAWHGIAWPAWHGMWPGCGVLWRGMCMTSMSCVRQAWPATLPLMCSRWVTGCIAFGKLTWLFSSFYGVAGVAPLQLGDEVAARNVGPAGEAAGPPENARYLPAFQVMAWLAFCHGLVGLLRVCSARWLAGGPLGGVHQLRGLHQLRGWTCDAGRGFCLAGCPSHLPCRSHASCLPHPPFPFGPCAGRRQLHVFPQAGALLCKGCEAHVPCAAQQLGWRGGPGGGGRSRSSGGSRRSRQPASVAAVTVVARLS